MLSLDNYITDGYINIPYRNVKRIIKQYGKDNLIKYLSNTIKANKLRYPLKRYLNLDPFEIAEHKTLHQIIEYPYVDELKEYQLDENRLYNGKELMIMKDPEDYNNLSILTDLFTESVRITAKLKKYNSPLYQWRNNPYSIVRKTISKALYKELNIDINLLESAIFRSTKICSLFDIGSVIVICNYFNAKIYFDPFAGWGGEALGACLSDSIEEYIGIDVNTNLREGYDNIMSFCKQIRPNKSINLITASVEDYNIEIEPDIILTSPPFFDYEIYSNDEEQSINKYPDYELWLNDWFLPMTLKLWRNLKSGGRLIYYIETAVLPVIDDINNILPETVFEGQIAISCGDLWKIQFLYVWLKC